MKHKAGEPLGDTLQWYGHMQNNSVTATVGDLLLPGEKIGLAGDTGFSDGVHLHFEVHTDNGDWYHSDVIDPAYYLPRELIPIVEREAYIEHANLVDRLDRKPTIEELEEVMGRGLTESEKSNCDFN